MKYRLLFYLLTLILYYGNSSASVEQIPYSWTIYTLNISPEGWIHNEDKADFDGIIKTVNYSTKTMQSIGADTYTALVAPSQTLLKNESDPSIFKTVNDYLISPAIKGEVSMYIKRFSAMDESAHKVSSVRLFPAIMNADGSYSVDTANEIETNFAELLPLMKNDSEYHKLVADLGEQYKAVAFRFDYVNVANLCAESALIPDTRKVKLNYVELSSGYTSPFKADPDGKVTLKCLINVTNEGNVTLSESDPRYYAFIALMNDDGQTYSQSAKGNLPALEPGQTGSAEIEFTFETPDGETDTSGRLTVRIDGYVSLDGANEHKQLGRYYATTIKVIPYTGIMSISYDNKTYNPGTPEKPSYIDLGCFRESASCEVVLNNTGAAPIVITGVNAPAGIAFDKLAQLPLTVEAGDQLTETFTINGEYLVEGPVSLDFDGTGSKTIYLRGKAIPVGVAFYDFEDDIFPSEWFATENNAGKWEITNNPVTDKNNKKSLRHSNSSYPSSATTGRIHFAKGDKLNFDVALRSKTSGELKVSISSDRKEWIELAEFGADGLFFPTKTGSWQSYALDIPEGEWYVEFYGSYLYLDNIYGGTEAPAAIDIVSLSSDAGNKAMVNYPLSVSASFYNFGQDLSDYQINLIADGEIVASEDGDVFGSKCEKHFMLSYYPHLAGEKEVFIQLAPSNGEPVNSENLTVDVCEESSDFEVQVGSSKGTRDDLPLSINYYNSRSETVYTSEMLGLGSCRISAIAYDYYKIMSADPKITKTLIWMQNTNDSAVGDNYTSTDDMVLVYEFDGNPGLKQGGNATDLRRMNFILDTPFEYTGGNLRVAIESHSDYYSKTFFSYDESESGILFSFEDNLAKFNAKSPTKAAYMPVTHFSAEKDPVIITGKVSVITARSTEESDMQGIEIKAKAKDADVRYQTLTDADGSYSLPIIRTDMEYTLSASHPLYQDSEQQDVDFTNPVHNFLLERIATGIEEVIDAIEEAREAEYYNLHGVRIDNPASGVYIRISGDKKEKVIIK